MAQKFAAIDAFLCTLSTRIRYGWEKMNKVYYEYPKALAEIGRWVRVKYFGFLSE